jgi:hypothetical protein
MSIRPVLAVIPHAWRFSGTHWRRWSRSQTAATAAFSCFLQPARGVCRKMFRKRSSCLSRTHAPSESLPHSYRPSIRDGPASILRKTILCARVFLTAIFMSAARTFRINGALYLWRRDHLANSEALRYFEMPHRMLEIPESLAIDIDTAHDFRFAELMLQDGMIRFPWL